MTAEPTIDYEGLAQEAMRGVVRTVLVRTAKSGLTGERVNSDILLTYAHDASAVPLPDPQVMNLVEKTSAFKLQTRALQDLEAGNIPAATQKLRGALTHLLNQGDTELAATVERELDNLEKGRVMTSEGRKTIRFESGKTVRLSEGTPSTPSV